MQPFDIAPPPNVSRLSRLVQSMSVINSVRTTFTSRRRSFTLFQAYRSKRDSRLERKLFSVRKYCASKSAA